MARRYVKMITAERDRIQKKKDWKRLKYRGAYIKKKKKR